MFISHTDLVSLITANYITFLILGGLLIMMLVYRDVHLPATRNFLIIIIVLFVMCVTSGLDRWAVLSPDRTAVRMAASVLHYILQPLVIFLELVIIIPDGGTAARPRRMLLELPLLINTAIYLSAPFAGKMVFWISESNSFHRGPLGFCIYIVTFFYLVLLVVWSIRFFRSDDIRKSAILFFMAGIAVLTGVLEGLNLASGYIDEAFALGVSLYYMYLVTMHESEMQASLARKEVELSASKITLLRQQIKPHFIFNSLQIIRSLIRSDPEKAICSLEDFSDYLRANIDVISSDSLISFEEELAHTEAYVSLALADGSKDIRVEYDIAERWFRLPPLTVEPMVENAIRHGLENGGTVRLSTRSETDDYVIVISDNGSGFTDPGTAKEKERTGAGIENVRTRLAMMCGGSLEINSETGGTEVTIRIPKIPEADSNEDTDSRR